MKKPSGGAVKLSGSHLGSLHVFLVAARRRLLSRGG